MNSDREIERILRNIVDYEGYTFESMDFDGVHYPWKEFARLVWTERMRIKMLARYPGLDHKEFQARNGRFYIYLWSVTREEFALRVQQVTEALGRPPDQASGDVDERGHVELSAAWSSGEDTENIPINIISFYSKGCKIDPRTPILTAKASPQLHPECKAALDELTDK